MSRNRRLQELMRKTEPEVLTIIGEESRRNATDKLTLRQIDRIVKEIRAAGSRAPRDSG